MALNHLRPGVGLARCFHLLVPLALLVSGRQLLAQPSADPVRLAGIVRFGTNTLAFLEDTTYKPPQASLLAEGESERRLSVIKIDAAQGKVEIHNAGTFSTLALPSDTAAKPNPGNCLHLQQAPLRPVLFLYQRLVPRTVIASPQLPDVRLDLNVNNASSDVALARAIEQALTAQKLVVRTEKEKFAIVGTQSDLAKVTPELWQLAADIQKPYSAQGEQQIPAGFLSFLGADLFQLENIYQSLAGRTLLRPSATSLVGNVWLRTATSLSRQEALYAFHLLLALSDVSIRPDGDKFLLLFPTTETKTADAVLNLKLPAHQVTGQTPIPPGGVELWAAGLPELKSLYERLSGQPLTLDPDLPKIHFLLRNQNSLTPAEALRALDLLLAWQGLAAVPQPDGKGLRLARLAPAK